MFGPTRDQQKYQISPSSFHSYRRTEKFVSLHKNEFLTDTKRSDSVPDSYRRAVLRNDLCQIGRLCTPGLVYTISDSSKNVSDKHHLHGFYIRNRFTNLVLTSLKLTGERGVLLYPLV